MKKGYTLIELMIVIAIIAIMFMVVFGGVVICAGNYWYTDQGVITALQTEHPEVTRILKAKRGVVSYTKLTVETKPPTEGGEPGQKKFCLGTNVLFNYSFHPCET